ncbi:hypothetical protein [Bradyrhizobium sp. URHD0069]|uniref:hypothetical protein n=1 Tax=Bradyrhizobium sp. URHD0069 TaxID=1380355 RepID=UPI0012DC68F7|nr:hypothetical protein [Bradyrhizobium sp. URHD0069]
MPWLEGFSVADFVDFVDFMLAPLVVDECCLLSFFDFASATSGEATSPAIASAPINNLVFIMRMISLGR